MVNLGRYLFGVLAPSFRRPQRVHNFTACFPQTFPAHDRVESNLMRVSKHILVNLNNDFRQSDDSMGYGDERLRTSRPA